MARFGHRHPLLGLGLAMLLGACGGVRSGANTSASDADAFLGLTLVSNGFGPLLPHQVHRLGTDGNPTAEIVSIRSEADLLANVRLGNPILPPPVFDSDPALPSGVEGNHFLYATFTEPLLIDSVLSSAPGQAGTGLAGSITIVALDPVAGTSTPVSGRAFVGGKTYAGDPVGSPPALALQEWLQLDANGNVVPNPAIDNDADGVPDGLGFPGTEGGFAGAADLLSPNTFVFVVDSDQDLTTHETFPAGVELRLTISTSVLSASGKPLRYPAVACTTVGDDSIPPEVLFNPPPLNAPRVVPPAGATDVDPLTTIRVEFSEPIQPWTLGDLDIGLPPTLSPAIQVQFGPQVAPVDMPYHIAPASPFDLTTWTLTPAFNFPGEGPPDQECGVFNRVDIQINSGQFTDLAGLTNSLSGNSFFLTGEGPGIVNAPVAPETIYVGRTGANPGISVIDLDGFGGGTGNPNYDPTFENIQEGDTNFPNNPNVKFQGSLMLPPLIPGTCTINGGSAGVFTLAKDSSLNDLIVRSPLVQKVDDLALGWALDTSFNNGPSPFGCQSGGGNLCATTGLKQVTVQVSNGSLNPAGGAQGGIAVIVDGGPNLVSWAPHPNPPPLQFPPLCVSPFLGAQEPTSIDSTLPPPPAPPPNGPGLANLLVPGDPFGDPLNGVPPSGLLATVGNSFFNGPSLPDVIQNCQLYQMRQQVGHFLYVCDRPSKEIVVLNSNRMTVIDRIPVPDPTSLAMGTNLDLLAVTNQSVDAVTFIDVDPSSSTFHQVVKTTIVGTAPRGIAWEPGNEDILVCNEFSDTVSVISAFSLEVRKELQAFLDGPFEVAITPRQLGFGFQRNVYFAYILNRSGNVAVFESGPNAVNGWGYDDVIGAAPQTFLNPKTIQPDPNDLRSAFWVVHEGPLDPETEEPGPLGEGAVTKCVVDSAISGQLPLNVQSLLIPQFRDMFIAAELSLGEDRISGVPVDLAFDNLLNVGGLPNWATSFSAGSPIPNNGKGLVRATNPVSSRRFLFLPIPNPNVGGAVVDVILLDGAFVRFDTNAFQPGVQSVPVPDCAVVMDYFRQ